MRKTHFLYCLLLCFFVNGYSHIFSQDSFKPQKNIFILDSLAGDLADRIIENLNKMNINKSSVLFTKHPANWLIKQHLLVKAKKGKIVFFEQNPKNEVSIPKIEINIKFASVNYNYVGNMDDRVFREVLFDINVLVVSPDFKISSIPDLTANYSDYISKNDIDYINSNDYHFAKANIPDKPKTFWEEFTEPLILVGSAALFVILLFTVRSG